MYFLMCLTWVILTDLSDVKWEIECTDMEVSAYRYGVKVNRKCGNTESQELMSLEKCTYEGKEGDREIVGEGIISRERYFEDGVSLVLKIL